jgi:hypothetical protein
MEVGETTLESQIEMRGWMKFLFFSKRDSDRETNIRYIYYNFFIQNDGMKSVWGMQNGRYKN